MIMDYCPGGSLAKLLVRETRLEETHAAFYLAEAVLGIERMHSLDIVYRNLKLDNVELDELGHIKLTGLNRAKESVRGQTNSFIDSVAHMPPEVIKSCGHGKSVDWYMAGVMLFEMLAGRRPFTHTSRKELEARVLGANIDMPSYFSTEAKDLVSRLMNRNPQSRPEAVEIKSHPFFARIDWERLGRKEVVAPVVELPEVSCGEVSDHFFSRASSLVSDMSYVQQWDYAGC